MTEPTNRGVILDLISEILLRAVIELKNELERVREQMANVE